MQGRTRGKALVGAAVMGALLLAGCSGGGQSDPEAAPPTATAAQSPTGAPSPSAQPDAPEAEEPASPGAYIDYADFEQDPAAYAGSGSVVLFFNADWCPTCRAADANFASSEVPAGLTVVSVDFDDSTDLRRQYGVTVQHTFVQIDAAGAELAKWTGSTTAAEVASRTV